MIASKRALGSDLAKVDAHQIAEEEYDDLPEIDEATIAEARRRGDVRIEALRLDPDVAERLRATGPDWQARANALLRAGLSAG